MVKDRAGVIVCPKLLATECKYCHRAGHTMRNCKMLAQKNQQREMHENTARQFAPPSGDRLLTIQMPTPPPPQRQQRQQMPGRRPMMAPLATSSRFDALRDSEDDEEPSRELAMVQQQGPSLGNAPQVRGVWAQKRTHQAPVVKKKSHRVRFASTNSVKSAAPTPTALDLIEKDFLVETVAKEASGKEAEVAPAAAAAVDFSSFLGDVADCWDDEMKNDTA